MLKQNTYRGGLVWTVLLNIVARGINFLLGIVLARNFLPESTDVFLFVWNGINYVLSFASTVNLLVVTPAYVTYKEKGLSEEVTRLNNAFLNIYSIPFLFLGVVILLFPMVVFGVFSGFAENQLAEAGDLLRFSGFWLTMVLVNNFLGNVLLSNKFFTASLVGQVVAGVVTLLFIIGFRGKLGISSFYIGHLLGNAISLVFYFWVLYTKMNFRPRIFFFTLPKNVLKETASVVTVSLPTMVASFLIIYLLSRMDHGFISAFNYGSNLSNLPDVILLSQLVSVIGVKFSELSASRNRSVLFDTYSMLCRHMFFLMSGIAIVIMLASPFFVEIIYGREKIGDELFRLTVIALSVLVTALPFKSLDILNNRLFASIQGFSSLLKYNLTVKIINIFLLFLLAKLFSFLGILIYTILMPLFFVTMHFYLLKGRFSAEQLGRHSRQLLLILFSCIVIYLVCWLADSYLLNRLPGLVRVLILSGLVLAMCAVTENVLKLTSFVPLAKNKIHQLLHLVKKTGKA